MDAVTQVIAAAQARAAALASGDADRLTKLLHADFRWTSHSGETFNRQQYIERNTHGLARWRSQDLSDVAVVVVGDTAVLTATTSDQVEDRGGVESFRMPMTQVWVRTQKGWQCLAGHAGPRLPS